MIYLTETTASIYEPINCALRIGDSIPARKQYLHGIQVLVPGLAVCECENLSRKKYKSYIYE